MRSTQWIGNAGRVLIGASVGLVFLILGERLRKRYPSYAYGLDGGGVAVALRGDMVCVRQEVRLLSSTVAFAFMAAVTATASC